MPRKNDFWCYIILVNLFLQISDCVNPIFCRMNGTGQRGAICLLVRCMDPWFLLPTGKSVFLRQVSCVFAECTKVALIRADARSIRFIPSFLSDFRRIFVSADNTSMYRDKPAPRGGHFSILRISKVSVKLIDCRECAQRGPVLSRYRFREHR